jgi:hypothetical protein
MLRFRPAFGATFVPGASAVPRALAVMFVIRSFSTTTVPWFLA